ncbi:glycosyltransferase [Turicimonas muris]|uniref:glycosyltransferase n=1 Tax=Turicimonas muris TaxID=1796652 RepID=UPI0026DF2022|nr:glycosyltransferase [Turicimonas muris]
MTELNWPIDISVVIPVHNVENYLDECLDSLHRQSLKTAEFIVINDGSTDHCAEVCNKYARLDNRFIVVHQECKGTLIARKRAFELARGKWCICVDGDDYLPFESVLETEVSLANKYDVDILRFDMIAFSEDEDAIKNYLGFRKEWVGSIETPLKIIQEIFANGIVGWGMADKIYRTSVVKKTIAELEEVALICGTDAYQFFLICFYSNTFRSVKTEPLYSYRLGTGISNGVVNIKKFASQSQILNIPKYLISFLKTQGKYEEYSQTIQKLTTRLIGQTVSRFHMLSVEESFSAFDYLFRNPGIKLDVLAALQKFYSKAPALLARKTAKACLLQLNKRRIKNIGIFYPRLHNGGVERVISMQAPLLQEHGFEVVLFTEEVTENDYSCTVNFPIVVLPRQGDPKRFKVLDKALVDNEIDLVIYHASSSPSMLFDLLTIKLCQRYFVLCRHENTTQSLAQNCTFFTQFASTYKLADSLVVLSSMERAYYRSYGIQTSYIPNPFPLSVNIEESLLRNSLERNTESLILHRLEKKSKPRHLVWIARLENNQKNYKEALEIFQLVSMTEKNVVCHIVGKGETNADAEYVRNFIERKNLQDNIIYEGFSLEPEQFLEIADIHLMTSTYECFPMSLVEAKTYAVPTVLYELPYLELLKDRKGYISVPRHDVAGAAEVICELLRNNDRRKQLALDAKSSIKDFMASNPSHIEGWLKLIHSLENSDSRQSLPVNQDFVDFVNTTISYCQEGINRHREEILRYQNLSKQYQEENNRLHAKIKSHQEELLYQRERIEQLSPLRKSEYDARMIERYAVCRDFVVQLCPLGTKRHVLIKKFAKLIYGLIKRGCRDESNRRSCDIERGWGGVNY